MKRFAALIVGLALCASLLTAAVAGSWGGGSCQQFAGPAPMPMMQSPTVPAAGQWWIENAPGELALFRDGRQIGYWRQAERLYYPLSGGVFGEPTDKVPAILPPRFRKDCDCSPACSCGDACKCGNGKPCCNSCKCILRGESTRAESNYGVVAEKIVPGTRRLNGVDISRKTAFEVVKSAKLPDDKGKQHLTIISADTAKRKRVLDDLDTSADLGTWKAKLLVQDYSPDEWPLAPGFWTKGDPTIYVQADDGKVLHRQDDYNDGPAGLAKALRKADPSYDPAKDPDLRKAAPQPAPQPQPGPGPQPQPGPDPVPAPDSGKPVPPILWAVGGAAAALLLSRAMRPQPTE